MADSGSRASLLCAKVGRREDRRRKCGQGSGSECIAMASCGDCGGWFSCKWSTWLGMTGRGRGLVEGWVRLPGLGGPVCWGEGGRAMRAGGEAEVSWDAERSARGASKVGQRESGTSSVAWSQGRRQTEKPEAVWSGPMGKLSGRRCRRGTPRSLVLGSGRRLAVGSIGGEPIGHNHCTNRQGSPRFFCRPGTGEGPGWVQSRR